MDLIEKFRKAQIKEEEREKQQEIEEKRLENQLILRFYEEVVEALENGETTVYTSLYRIEDVIEKYFEVVHGIDEFYRIYLNERGLKKLQKKVNKIKKEDKQ